MAALLNPRDGAFFDLSARTKIRVAGQDRTRFLNGQVTNDVRRATSAKAIVACVLNAKGKMDAHIVLSAESDCFLIDAAPELRETLLPRIERYIIADDVQLEDATERFSIFHVLGRVPAGLGDNCKILSANRFREPGSDIWVDAARRDEVFGRLSAALPLCNGDDVEVFRIERGIPRWGRELTQEIIPPEANLEESCIDYEKGCYIGQEVISRMKMSGQKNKRLCGLVSLHNMTLAPGMRLFSTGPEEKEVGWVTSAAPSKRLEKKIALAYVKRGFNSVGSNLNARLPSESIGAGVSVEIVELPFRSEAIGIG
jgi:folate-binding protein YgfZ